MDIRRPLSAGLPALLPVLVVLGVVGRLLGGPVRSLEAGAVFFLSALPGLAIYPLLRPSARRIERVAGGLALGLPIECVAFVAADRAGLRDPIALVAILAAAGAAVFAVAALRGRRGERGGVAARVPRGPRWRAAVSLAILLGVAAAMYLPPVLSLGAERPDGSRAFVRNFGLDFLRHLSLAEAAARGPLPPAWYYADGERGENYWLYYTGPALLLRALPEAEPHRVLAAWNFLLLAVFVSYLAARAGRGWRAEAFGAGAALLLIAGSTLRALAAIAPGASALLAAENRFVFTAPLFFALFMGHHLLAIVMLLLLHALYRPGAASATLPGACAAGFLLPITVFISPFVGVVAAAWAALLTLHGLVARPARRRRVVTAAVAAGIPGLALLGLYVATFGSRFSSLGHSGLETAFDLRMQTLPIHLVLCMAPMLFVAGAGWRCAARTRAGQSAGWLVLASAGVAATLVVRTPGYLFTEHEVATKTGMVLLVALTLVAGPGLRSLFTSPGAARWAQAAMVALAAAGLANSVAYVRSYSDVASARSISAGDWEAAAWIRGNLPADARIIVSVSQPYGPKNYSFLPALAGRQVLLGRKGEYLEPDPIVARIDDLYRGDRAALAWWAATHAGWFVYCGGAERAVNAGAIATLDALSGALEPVYRGDGVRVYRIRSGTDAGSSERAGPPIAGEGRMRA